MISKCDNSFMLGPDKLLWYHLESILKQDNCLSNIINIADTCINLGHQPNHFKRSSIVVILKPNKQLYDHSKSFHPIILLNTLGKLIEKVIGKRLQFHIAASDFIYLSQLGGLKFKSTTDAGIALTHIICLGQVKNNTTSILAFDIAQFFPSLNHYLLTCILQKAGLNICIVNFFTNYVQNNFSSPTFEVNIGVG